MTTIMHTNLFLAVTAFLLHSASGFVPFSSQTKFPTSCWSPPSQSSSTRLFFEPTVPNFCGNCGSSEMVLQIPQGDERLRACCSQCDYIEYSNPKIVAACVVRTLDDDDSVLMGQRSIEPRKGTWGIPQGYMEHGETSREAAVREVWEETGVTLDPASLQFRAVYNVPGSVQLVYEAILTDAEEISKAKQEIEDYNNNHGKDTESPKESQQVALLSKAEVEDKEICFPTVQWALDHCRSNPKSNSSIQQMTKMYDPATEKWSQYEDEAVR
ncbi:Nudix hydrolase 23, chloroplastic [Seminavis robusta]|uniref:Nudix hydrolase 23, chloroplastic n=1 Tax=Seminavis robusta TaxID=568900 RepID=A0A9N8DSX3_9STRA|nr:Nudix hydrolase 23, chloroplastic [Seminavis robusta]|eukprot:Sro228_g092720.1 Nudix hydrolase 23, chloroplastic (270) ;mRNA; r:55430-56239